MRHKMTRKLVLYFSITLLVFALILGFAFSSMFRESTRDQARQDLQYRAETIAGSLAVHLENTQSSSHMGHMSSRRAFTSYLEALDEVAIGDVWIVDPDSKIIKRGQESADIQLRDLPRGGEQLILDALGGKSVFSDGFSELLNSESVTVGVPIIGADKQIVGAVLLHSPIAGIDAVINHGYHVLLINSGVALLLSVLVAIILSNRFVKPLKKMSDTALQLSKGDYKVRTEVSSSDEIGDLAKTLDILSAQLEAAAIQRDNLDHMRNEFFADISHELRTPITVLRGTLETLHDTPTLDRNDHVAYHETMIQEVVHLQKLVDDLLDFSKLNATDFSLDMTTVNIADIINDSVRSLRIAAQNRNITVRVSVRETVEPQTADYARLRQMFTIILDNALKFTSPDKGVDIIVSKRSVTIQDYGKGIAPENLEKIFNRFYKTSGTDNELGNGIGLAIAKQIAVRHGIIITVESEPNTQTSFVFEF